MLGLMPVADPWRRRGAGISDRRAPWLSRIEEVSIVALDAHGHGLTADGAIVPGALPGERALDQDRGQARGACRDARPFARARGADLPLVRNLRRLRRAAHVGFALSRMEARPGGRSARARGRRREGRGRLSMRMAQAGAARPFTPAFPMASPTRSASCARARTTSSPSTIALCSAPAWPARFRPRRRSAAICAA